MAASSNIEAKVNRLTSRQLESLQNAVNALNEFIVESAEGATKDSGTLDDAQSSDSPTDNLDRLQSELLVPLPEGLSSDSVSIPSDAEGISHFRQFQRICSELLSESINFEYAMRSIGSGGPSMEAASTLRKSLRSIHNLFKINTTFLFESSSVEDQMPKYILYFPDALDALRDSVTKFGDALADFVEVFYNEKLMRLLARLTSLLNSRRAELNGIFSFI